MNSTPHDNDNNSFEFNCPNQAQSFSDEQADAKKIGALFGLEDLNISPSPVQSSS